MKILDLVIVAALCAAPCIVAGHGNNPRHGTNTTQPMFFQWVGVNIGGELFAVPSDQYAILSALTDINGWQMAAPSNAVACGELAILLCGEGQICCFCFSGNGQQSCSFSCQDDAGDCEPCPECGPDIRTVADYLAE